MENSSTPNMVINDSKLPKLGISVALIFGFVILQKISGSIISVYLLDLENPEIFNGVFSSLLYIFFGVTVVTTMKRAGYNFLNLYSFSMDMKTSAINILLLLGMVILTILFYEIGIIRESGITFASTGIQILLIITTIFLSPFIHEIVFRGFLSEVMKVTINAFWVRILMSAVIYSAVHFSFSSMLNGGGANIFLFIIGFALAYSYEQSRSLFYPTLIHIVISFATIYTEISA